ncbi:MAG: glycerol kinase GlpK, partial [Blastocatellia bacterium]|nr:glycerol kinase GlpK [Blastocatellia bacterium]
AREMAAAGQLAVGTVDSWLIWQLSGGRLHVSDPSNASRTLLYNIKTLDWDDQLLSLFDIPRSILPEIVPSSGVIGKTTLFGDEIAIAGLAGDQQAALFGQGCYSPATAKNTYGTGCFVLLNTGQEIVHSKNRLLTTVAWQLEGKPVCYALEGSVFIAGAAVGWLRDGLKIIDSADETTALAASVEDSGGVYFVPAFVGLGSPYWDQYARGTIIGITRGTTRAHIVRATLESIAYQTRDLLEALKSDTGYKISELRVDGGAAVNDLLLQMQADILGVDVVRPKIIESTVAGAGFLAGIATNFWDMSQLTELTTTTSAHFKPVREQKIREAGYKKWLKAVERAAKWVEEEEFN